MKKTIRYMIVQPDMTPKEQFYCGLPGFVAGVLLVTEILLFIKL